MTWTCYHYKMSLSLMTLLFSDSNIITLNYCLELLAFSLKNFLDIYCKLGLLAVNFLFGGFIFCWFFERVLYVTRFLVSCFTLFMPFNTLKMPSHWLLGFIVSYVMSNVNFMMVSLLCCIFLLLLSRFSFSLAFNIFLMTCLSIDLFVFSLLGIQYTWMCSFFLNK